MKCQFCLSEGGVRELFKRKDIHRFQKIYYICRKCRRSNRVEEQELKPQQRRQKKLLADAKEIRSDFLECLADVKFKILVWGPSEGNTEKKELYQKRKQIRDILREKGQTAYFSEELDGLNDDNGTPLPTDIAELLQVNYFNLVINLADSQGSLMEAERFTRVLGERCLLWFRKGTERGYAGGLINSQAMAGRPPLPFDDEEVESCLMAMASEDWVHGLRMYELSLNIEEKMIEDARIIKRNPIQ